MPPGRAPSSGNSGTPFQFDFRENALAGKVILLAGGSGGLGSATAFLLAHEQPKLVIGYHSNRIRAESLRAALQPFGGGVELVEGDLNNRDVAEEYLRRASALGPLFGLAVFVGDPARASGDDATETAEEERMLRSWKTNFYGPFHLAQMAAEQMAAQRTAGSIVLISTMQALVPFEKSTTYAAPKAALAHAARVLAREVGGPQDILVNVVAPGVTVAGMAAASVAAGKYARFVEEGVIPRYGRAEDVARAVRLLLEPDSYITGEVITVDGGLTLRR